MLIETNILSLIITPFMFLYFFNIVYSLNKRNYWIKNFISLLLLIFISIICYFMFKDSILNLCLLFIINIVVFNIIEKNNILEYIFISLYFIFLKLLSYVIVTWIFQ